MRSLFVILSMFWAILAPLSSSAVDDEMTSPVLKIKISGIKSDKGPLGILVFSSKQGFPGDEAKAVFAQVIEEHVGQTVEITVPKLSLGNYAISIYHDENENGKLDKNFLGIPKEAVGVSNNPKAKGGRPSFEKAKFEFKKDGQIEEVPMIYP